MVRKYMEITSQVRVWPSDVYAILQPSREYNRDAEWDYRADDREIGEEGKTGESRSVHLRIGYQRPEQVHRP
jgi:hypothetical protein